jgi:hypothetical protein
VLRRIVFLLALVGALFMSTAAVASARDRNHDRLPDRWEKRHDLKLKFKQAKRDQDRDGLKNLAEFRARMDPRDDDSDDDGVGDDEENAGKIASFEDGRLTIALFAGGEVSGLVTDDTEIECGDDERGDDDEHGDDDEDDECAADALTANAVVKEAELTLGSGGAVFDEIELR